MNKISTQDYCKNFVRDNDYHLYLLHFFAPRPYRRSILALMALHTELRLIPKKVQDPMMRIIRLKWWEDEIAKDNHADSPILTELSSLSIDWNNYFDRFDKSLRGEDADIDEVFYALMVSTLPSQKSKHKFTKKLMHHDQLEDKKTFRALRLALCV